MLHVGLTGNIASGKSNAGLVFAELGAHIVDADLIAHELLLPGAHAYSDVVCAFGSGILDESGAINRRALGQIVFSSPQKRQLLNSLIHPGVRAEVLRRIVELEMPGKKGIILVDAALMIETGFFQYYDRLIVVYCDPSIQLSRLMSRDGFNVEEARARIAAQMPAEEKRRLAHYTIETSGTLRQTREQVEAVYRDLLLYEMKMK
jgi:dephospho-CoA kinase